MVKQVIKKCKYRFHLPVEDQECIGHECESYQKMRGTHPQTGEPVDEYMCSELWTNILLVENSQMQRQTGAAVESFRNRVIEQNDSLAKALVNPDEPKLIESN